MIIPTPVVKSKSEDLFGSKCSRLVLLAIGVIACALYARMLDVYFISDDFMLLRIMAGDASPQHIVDHLTSTWLSLQFLQMYRPLSSLWFYLGYQVFGVNPFWYHLGSLCVHVANVMLVIAVANSLTNRRNAYIGYVAGLLFAVHPLHPNAVAWMSAFPTVLCTFFILVSLLTFLCFMETGVIGYYLCSLGAFVCALGSYETALVYPALVAGCAWLKDDGRVLRRKMNALASVYIPFVLIVAGYFLIRKALLGGFMGGLPGIDIVDLIAYRVSIYPRVLAKLVYPLFSQDSLERLVRWGIFACIAVYSAVSIRRLLTRETVLTAVFVLFWVFIGTFLTEAIFEPVFARHGYLPSIGVCIGLSFLVVRPLSLLRTGRTYLLSGALLMVVVLCYVRLLNQSLGTYEEAGRLTRTIQQQIVALDSVRGSGNAYFMGNVPHYLTIDGYDRTQVLIPGISDSVRPPFTKKKTVVYPFINVRVTGEVPLISSEENIIVITWNQEIEEVQVIASTGTETGASGRLRDIEAVYPLDEVGREELPSFPGFVFAGGTYEKFRLTVLTPHWKPLAFDVTRRETVHLDQLSNAPWRAAMSEHLLARKGEDILFYSIPYPYPQFLADMGLLYGDELFWWVEAFDEQARVVARSTVKGFRLAR